MCDSTCSRYIRKCPQLDAKESYQWEKLQRVGGNSTRMSVLSFMAKVIYNIGRMHKSKPSEDMPLDVKTYILL